MVYLLKMYSVFDDFCDCAIVLLGDDTDKEPDL